MKSDLWVFRSQMFHYSGNSPSSRWLRLLRNKLPTFGKSYCQPRYIRRGSYLLSFTLQREEEDENKQRFRCRAHWELMSLTDIVVKRISILWVLACRKTEVWHQLAVSTTMAKTMSDKNMTTAWGIPQRPELKCKSVQTCISVATVRWRTASFTPLDSNFSTFTVTCPHS